MNKRINFDDLYQLIDIVLVVSNKINLTKKGSNYWGLCPFHSDSSPSLSVNSTKKIFKCFSCGASGNAVGFLQRLENLNFMNALKEALVLSNVDSSIIEQINNNLKISNQEKVYLLNKQAMILMNNYLLMNLNKPNVKNFIEKRHLTNQIINKFTLGYCSGEYFNNMYDTLFQYCQDNFKDEIPDDLLKKTNLFKYNEDKKSNSLFFSNRLIFPIINKYSNVIGFGARDLSNNSQAKYINSPESKTFIKGDNLYNFYSIANLDNNDSILIVEGYMDCITLVNHGYLYSVATMGTALSDHQLNLIFELSNLKKITLSFDNDLAGENAFIKNLTNILDYEVNNNVFIPVYISGLNKTTYKDPDELFNNEEEKKAKDIFNQEDNALFKAATFILKHDKNLDYSLNEALKFILFYTQYNFGIYADHAIKLFSDFLIQNYNIEQTQIDEIISKLKATKIEHKKSKNSSSKKEEKPNKKINYEKEKLLKQMLILLDILNKNYVYLIFIFLFHPNKVLAFKKEYDNIAIKNNILVNQKTFNDLNTQIKKHGFFEIYNENSLEYWIFINYSYLLYIYIDYFDFTKLKENDFVSNLNYVLKESNWFNNLRGDVDFKEGQGILHYLENNIAVDYKNNLAIKKLTQDQVNDKIKLILKNIFELLNREIPNLLVKLKNKNS